MGLRPHGAFDVSPSGRDRVDGFCDVGFLSKWAWTTATGSSLIKGPEIDAPPQERGEQKSPAYLLPNQIFCAVEDSGLNGREKRHLQVNVTNPVQCSLHGKKCTVSVETRLNQPQPDFTKNRSGFILSVPGN
ncbi:hypothetical protein CB1_000848003 [Camelus ferus]|nr:hypothetical protein CB1_000848003 [Camelus ferus]